MEHTQREQRDRYQAFVCVLSPALNDHLNTYSQVVHTTRISRKVAFRIPNGLNSIPRSLAIQIRLVYCDLLRDTLLIRGGGAAVSSMRLFSNTVIRPWDQTFFFPKRFHRIEIDLGWGSPTDFSSYLLIAKMVQKMANMSGVPIVTWNSTREDIIHLDEYSDIVASFGVDVGDSDT